MLNRDVLRLYNVLSLLRQRSDELAARRQAGEDVPDGTFSARFAVISAVNLKRLEPAALPLRGAMGQPWFARFGEYNRRLEALKLDHVTLPEGVTSMQPNQAYPLKDNEAWEQAVAALNTEFADAFEGRDATEELLSQEAEPISLMKVKLDDLHRELGVGLTMEQGEVLIPMVDLGEDETKS